MIEEFKRTKEDKTKKENSLSILKINNSTDSVIDGLDDDDVSTPRALSSQSPGPKSALQLGNLLISSGPGLSLNSPGGGPQHPEAKSLSSSGVIIPTFATHSTGKEVEGTEKAEGGLTKTKFTNKNLTEIKLGLDQDDDEKELNKAQEKNATKENLEDVEVEIEKVKEKNTKDEKETKKEEDEESKETEKEEEEEEEDEECGTKDNYSRWETRIADYFAVIGTDTKEVISESKSDEAPKTYTAKVLDRIPTVDYKDTHLPGGLDIFCFPNGINGTASKENAGPVSSIFTLTSEDGTRLYAISLRIYEKVPTKKEGEKEEEEKEEKKEEKEEKVEEWYIPYCLCIISHRPFFSLYKSFLSSVYAKLRNSEDGALSDIGDYITDFLFNTPVPSPGTLSLEYGNNKQLKLPFAEDFPYVDVNTLKSLVSFHTHSILFL